jgi:ABC-type branched-subunit amino acid transport system substrate-binding protein
VGSAVVGAVVPLTGRYAVQGRQVRLGIELWAERAGARLLVLDDGSRPERAARLFSELVARGCRFILGPYGSDSARAVAGAGAGAAIWNHGAAADDVQRLPAVVSVPSPASRYLVALARAAAALRPGASVAVVAGSGPFARFAGEGLEREAESLDLSLLGHFSFRDSASVAALAPDVVLACGPLGREVALFRALATLPGDSLLGGLSPGLAVFPSLLGADPEGFIAPVQWDRGVRGRPAVGPTSSEVASAAHARGVGEIDYVAAQAYAAALIAEHCLELSSDDPLAVARSLRTETFFGAFELDESGLQRGHRLSVVRWRDRRRELVAAEVA